MNQELVHLVEQIGREKGIETALLIDAIRAAVVSASRKRLGQLENIDAEIDLETGQISLAIIKEAVEEMEEPDLQCTLEEAREQDPEATVGDQVRFPVELDVSELGRIAAQTAKQVIVQRVREAEREMIYNEYKDREGDLIMGIVQRYEKGNYIIDLGKAEAILPYREQSFREQFHRGDRIRAFVLEVRNTTRGPQIVLSRTHPGLLTKLFEMEVPEVYEGIVEIAEAVREPSGRAKIAVRSKERDVDPVGACVGVRGSRVQAIVGELRGEKIDIIAWSDDSVKFVTNALSPAKISKVVVHEDENTMEVIVPEDQLSLAIGKKGQNVRLAAKLTRWKIDIKSHEDFKKREDEIALAAAEALLGPRKRAAEPTLEHIPGVGGKTAEALRDGGLTSLAAVASASLEDLVALPGIGKKKADVIRAAAIEILAEVQLVEPPPGGSPMPEAPPDASVEELPEGEPEDDKLSDEKTAEVEDSMDEEPLGEEGEEERQDAPLPMDLPKDLAEASPPGDPQDAGSEGDEG